MKKQLLRVKQIADQTFLRAEKTEVLTEDLVNAEKRVDVIKQSCQIAHKKIASCSIDFGSETSAEKRLRKIPQVALGNSMQENANCFSSNSVLGATLKECATTQTKLGSELLEYYTEVEKSVLKPIMNVLENEMHSINKLRKQLGKLTLDMDSARTRFQTAEKQAASGSGMNNATGKIDILRDELEEASQKVDQCRDALAAEMFSLIGKEPQLSQVFVHLHQLQANYHRNALTALESSLPVLENYLSNFPQKPVYGCSLEEHLRVTNRQTAQVIETCVNFLLEYGIMEEGLLRIAGSASKLKKLKSAFDAGLEIVTTEYIRDPHAVSGALKSYLRELPEPLMTFSLYEEWLAAVKIQDSDSRLQALWHVVHKLPEANFHNLQYVIKFLAKLYENADVNKMSSQNIAIVMAPNLLWSPVEDSNATFGMNMSAASLHSTVIETLISYADWFFPDLELSVPSKSSTSAVTQANLTNTLNNADLFDGETESKENVLLNPGSNTSPPSHSPRAMHRSGRKPAAPPPPPALKSSADEHAEENEVPISTLIDLSYQTDVPKSSSNSDLVIENSNDLPSEIQNSALKESVSGPKTSLIRRRSNENITNNFVTSSSKPNIPEKPTVYSSYSLDRKLQRSSYISKHNEKADYVPRHIERPSVPPPERPAKPSRLSTCENVIFNSEMQKSAAKCDDDNVFVSELKPSRSVSEMPLLQEQTLENDPCFVSEIKQNLQNSSPVKTPPKQNRFDFLVTTYTSEKPPERPPRCTSLMHDTTEKNSTADSNVNRDSEKQQVVPVPAPRMERSIHNEVQGVVPCNPTVKSIEGEKVKPPRPQPPVPAKPKTSLSENTDL